MSHGDQHRAGAPGFARSLGQHGQRAGRGLRSTRDSRMYGIQFHPEVMHTGSGGEILRNFLFGVCGCRGDWRMASPSSKQTAAHPCASGSGTAR